jgi:hypothetical protein
MLLGKVSYLRILVEKFMNDWHLAIFLLLLLCFQLGIFGILQGFLRILLLLRCRIPLHELLESPRLHWNVDAISSSNHVVLFWLDVLKVSVVLTRGYILTTPPEDAYWSIILWDCWHRHSYKNCHLLCLVLQSAEFLFAIWYPYEEIGAAKCVVDSMAWCLSFS